MRFRLRPSAAKIFFLIASLSLFSVIAHAQSAYVRVSQVGYEPGPTAARAYLIATAAEPGATFKVVSANGDTAYSGKWERSSEPGPIKTSRTRSTRSTSRPRQQLHHRRLWSHRR